ncbi:hypothetical protein CANCADRAFT_17313, partial [Tortispora caseinolytica NRRL Y-17796]
TSYTVTRHYLGVLPEGNLLLSGSANPRSDSLGTLSILDDETILSIIQRLDCQDILQLQQTSKYMYALCDMNEVWKQLLIERDEPITKWYGSWKGTALGKWISSSDVSDRCKGVYSDTIFRPYMCSQYVFDPFKYEASFNIPRIDSLTNEEFNAKWYNRPHIVTSSLLHEWTLDDLVARYGERLFRAENFDITLSAYRDYVYSNTDESPLYLFDKSFAEGTTLGDEYKVASAFDEDLFTILKEERPDHRWLIIGPPRSGSTFHQDPNNTCAWNLTITGHKYWIFFPPRAVPPGIHVTKDKSEVTAPVSIPEWMTSFYSEARRLPEFIHGISKPGDTIYVPAGWWHLVLNIGDEPTIAVTQNFVPKSQVRPVLKFLRDRSDQISGF